MVSNGNLPFILEYVKFALCIMHGIANKPSNKITREIQIIMLDNTRMLGACMSLVGYHCTHGNSEITLCKNLLFSPLFRYDSPWLVLRVWMVGEFGWTTGDWTAEEELLEVVEDRRVLLCQERNCPSRFTSSSGTTNTMRIIWN